MRRTAGITIAEVLIVVAILAIIAAILFPAYRTASAKSLEAKTVSNLKQIYGSMLLYSGDYDLNDEVLGLESVPARPLMDPTLLFRYGLDQDQLFSGAYPASGKKRWISSFIWYSVGAPGVPDGKLDETRRAQLAKERGEFTIVRDTVHDYFEYWPVERDQDPLMLREFQINMRVNGSIRRERGPGIRGTIPQYW